jgi:alpha-amylase
MMSDLGRLSRTGKKMTMKRSHVERSSCPRPWIYGRIALPAILLSLTAPLVMGQSDSQVMLQMFESSWDNLEYRTVDIWQAGYRDVWVPPPGRADIGDFSVGYDVYDRFDLGESSRHTLYGTQSGIMQFNRIAHKASLFTHVDLILNHNGFSDNSTSGFLNAGDYPGFVIEAPGHTYGDFHSPFAGGDWDMRVSGLVDIDQSLNLEYIRHPVDVGDPRNIPAGTTPAFGRLADVPDESNRQFYTDRQGESFTFTNPVTGNRITKYRFDLDDPMTGDPVVENATGLLLRYTQWMGEVVGFDGYRIDAMKHMPNWFFNDFYDDAAYKSGRVMLNGERLNPFSFGEVFDGDWGKQLGYTRKNSVANRDVLDFSLYFTMKDNLTANGLGNDWRRIVGSSVDVGDNGFVDGSMGVRFVQSHDSGGPDISNVAHAYSLLLPGRSLVYFNAKEFGEDRDFPLDGRGDALGGIYGDRIKTLVRIAGSHARGSYHQRYLTKETLVYERDANLVVGLSNRSDTGTDKVTVATNFLPGTILYELTGNSEDPFVDPDNVISKYIQVQGNGNIEITVPRNKSRLGQHNSGYVAYGPGAPVGELSLTNVAYTIEPDEFRFYNNYENGTNRLSEIAVIQSNSFDVSLQTEQILVPTYGRDYFAEGDNALFRFNDGVDLTGEGFASVDPGNAVAYAFQQFEDKSSGLYGGGDGEFRQAIDATKLDEGMNYLTVRAFRHRDPSDGSAIYTDFMQAIYLDLLPPETDIVYPEPANPGEFAVINNRMYEFVMNSVDYTADSMHLLLDEDGDPLSNVNQTNKADQVDRAEFRKSYSGLSHGAHKLDLVAFELTGNSSVLTEWVLVRLYELGDLDHNGRVTQADFDLFGGLWGLSYVDSGYDPSADFDVNGRINAVDYGLFAQVLGNGVPTPGGFVVLSIFAAGMMCRGRGRRRDETR